jgi:uncharacterized protein
MPGNRSKRLRKKLHKGEFIEFGFWITFSLLKKMDAKTEDAFIDRFLAEAIDVQNLFFGGGIGKNTSGFVTLIKRGSATEEHRQYVKNWLNAQANISKIEIGELQDAWQ